MATGYELYVVNNSPEYVLDFCVYQTPPDRALPTIKSLAWLVKTAHQKTTLRFDWTIDYSFVWAESGPLLPGALFQASQVVPADPATTQANQIQFDKTMGAYLFVPGPVPNLNARPGTLYIAESDNIPQGEASIGIGMSGNGTFAVEAEPNMLATFTPHPTYWLAAGDFVAGQVVDIDVITNALPVEFLPGINTMTATLDGSNTWSLAPGSPRTT